MSSHYTSPRMPWSVWSIVIIWVVAFCAIGAYQHTHFLYDGLDLGIYDQVIWNTSHGRWFAYSFNPYSYLVDHREWLIVGIAPLYRVLAHPLVLIVLQSVALGVSGLLVYCLAQVICNARYRIALIATVVFLLHPSLHALALFEFHILSFAVPLVLWLWLCIEREQFRRAWIVWIVLLLLRDDVALMLIGVGVLIALRTWRTHRREAMIALCMGLLSLCWFLAMHTLGAHLAPTDAPKFFFFYSWMGNTPTEALRFFMAHPLHTFSVVIRIDHLAAIALIVFSTAGLCVVRPRYLLPALVALVPYFLIDRSVFEALLLTHHAAVWLPWVVIASLYGYKRINQWGEDRRFPPRILHAAVGAGVCAAVLISNVLWEPWQAVINKHLTISDETVAAYRTLVRRIPAEDHVMTSARLYPHLSQREHLYSTLQLWSGTQHYSEQPYEPPERVDWILLEQEELREYEKIFTPEQLAKAKEQLNALIARNNLVERPLTDGITVFAAPDTP